MTKHRGWVLSVHTCPLKVGGMLHLWVGKTSLPFSSFLGGIFKDTKCAPKTLENSLNSLISCLVPHNNNEWMNEPFPHQCKYLSLFC